MVSNSYRRYICNLTAFILRYEEGLRPGQMGRLFGLHQANITRQLRNWAKSHGMPRFVFVKVPTEMKPFYLDFDSPIYVDIFTKAIRKMDGQSKSNEPVLLTEMLPAPDQLWLTDAESSWHRNPAPDRPVAVPADLAALWGAFAPDRDWRTRAAWRPRLTIS